MKNRLTFALVLAFAGGAASAQQPAPAAPSLTLEQRTGLRCAAAFALASDAQVRGDAEARSLPPLADRGREFFVRYSAQLMDDTGMTREAVAAMLGAEARALVAEKSLAQIMPACLILLDASGL